jgi:hypothetical protein
MQRELMEQNHELQAQEGLSLLIRAMVVQDLEALRVQEVQEVSMMVVLEEMHQEMEPEAAEVQVMHHHLVLGMVVMVEIPQQEPVVQETPTTRLILEVPEEHTEPAVVMVTPAQPQQVAGEEHSHLHSVVTEPEAQVQPARS